MAAKPSLIQRITAWSYSRYTTYKQCAFKAKCSIILKIKEPSNSAMDRGSMVHAEAAKFIQGKVKSLDGVFNAFRRDMLLLKKEKAACEEQWAFNDLWEECGWFDNDCRVRIQVDAHWLEKMAGKKVAGITVKQTRIHVIDFKTGRKKDEHADQRSLYALGALLKYPDAAEVVVSHWYLDSGEEGTATWKRSDLKALKALWEKNTKAMLLDTRFAPSPGSHCQYCYYSKEKNGPCKF